MADELINYKLQLQQMQHWETLLASSVSYIDIIQSIKRKFADHKSLQICFTCIIPNSPGNCRFSHVEHSTSGCNRLYAPVEAALTNSPDDPELMKLKTDLEEVIELTAELVRTQTQPKKEIVQTKKESSYQPDILPSVAKTKGEWKSGDRCLAQLADDGKFYEGTIETIDGEAVAVLIDGQKAAAVTTLDFIKDLPRTHPNEMKHKKQPVAKYREYQKKRKLAKQQRFKQLEEEREVEKNKWLAFATKGVKKGIPKKSIFASPDNVNGRVGIGTCGLGGKGMTEFPTAEKRKK
ncbi:hypothetical protein AGLY_013631 [Aphis glycines]|uniref:Tudor domain-containing protein n=3 Tax=Aphidini TaxID=33387 RepID=A0A6G0T7Q8_APHGL|nr:hypothetical protein AGLY_013631 [Aphis glycines]